MRSLAPWFRVGRKAVGVLGDPICRRITDAAAWVVASAKIGGTAQLRDNLARVVPDADAATLSRLTREGVRRYFHYYYEALALPTMNAAHIEARIREVNLAPLRQVIDSGAPAVVALTHSGNWDLAGAWSQQALAQVVTVAEKLSDTELFEDFMSFRTGLGMEIIPFQAGQVFRQLVRRGKGSPAIFPLLADRDLGRHGIDVSLAGHPARVAAGPAALAKALKAPLFMLTIGHERLRGVRKHAAGSSWGIVIHAHQVPLEDRSTEELTQAWIDEFSAWVTDHPADWHMMQPVFHADLDQRRLAHAQAQAGQTITADHHRPEEAPTHGAAEAPVGARKGGVR